MIRTRIELPAIFGAVVIIDLIRQLGRLADDKYDRLFLAYSLTGFSSSHLANC